MSRKISFTKAAIEGVQPPAPGQRLILMDTRVAGLQCRVSHTGVKTFSLFRRVKGGLPERVTLGKYPDMTVEKARIEATKINGMIAAGERPAAIRRAHRTELTFQGLFLEYLKRYAKRKKRTWKNDQSQFTLYLEKPLGKKKLSEIRRTDIAAIHNGISRQTKKASQPRYKSSATANRILALASSVFG